MCHVPQELFSPVCHSFFWFMKQRGLQSEWTEFVYVCVCEYDLLDNDKISVAFCFVCAVILYACPLYMNVLNMQLRLEKMQGNRKCSGLWMGGGGTIPALLQPSPGHTHTH